MRHTFIRLLLLVAPAVLFSQTEKPAPMPEKHLKNIRQLTFGGDNAEAYWSPDSKSLTFQSNNPAWKLECDQIFAMDVNKAAGDSTYKPRQIGRAHV